LQGGTCKTDRKISDKQPKDYLPALIEKSNRENFVAQCIPTNTELLGLDVYKEFLANRRKLIAERLNEFLGVTKF